MNKSLALALYLMVLLCCVGTSMAQDTQERVWLNPERYKIVLLKPVGGEWPSGFNELILLDTETGRTWTPKSKRLTDGWVLMPREEGSDKEP